MPPPLYTQRIIALIWDFDKTLTHSYMQDPLFKEYGVDAKAFWSEVNQLHAYYGSVACPGGPARVGNDTIYLNHILTYVREGRFKDLTNTQLRELGAKIPLAPGLPECFDRLRAIAADVTYAKHELRIEHYIVSTGLRAMIEGSALADSVDGIWACELLPEAAPSGFGKPEATRSPVVAQIGYTIDNTSKTRAIFEINKGVNLNSAVEVNSLVPESQRRVPIQNMIYIADGPSDIPSFSLVNGKGGKTLGVYAPDKPGSDANFNNAAQLEDQGRVNSIAEANYTMGLPADRWLRRTIKQMADRIVRDCEIQLASFSGAPGHKV